jgi:O-antigen/teichoic acid export membrane protein
MEDNNYKRILKNAGLLYFRMLLTMAVTLYTSRVVLATLGVEDFGIYHLVGGFITVLGFLHGAMSSATQRFLSFEIGKPGTAGISNIFSMSMNIHLLIAAGILLVGETAGLWFVSTQLTIPPERMAAAQWVYHLSLLAFLVTVISVPYNAMIIAHEQMSVFAWVSVFDVSLKLLIVFMLAWAGSDHLITYAALTFVVVMLITAIYKLYCGKKYPDSRFRFYWDSMLFKTMLSYTGWNMWGNAAAVLGNQGVNVILNIFFGPAVNAARAITFQISGALNSFVQNLQVAVNPQIIKSYASGDFDYMHKLVYYGAKYNFFLLLFFALPIAIEVDTILNLWLTVVPEHTGTFVQLALAGILIDSISAPLMTAAQATGKIKLYQTVVGGILLLNLPLSYVLLHAGFAPSIAFVVSIALSIASLIARLVIISPLVNLSIKRYTTLVLLRVVGVGLVSLTLALLIKYFLPENTNRFFVSACSLLSIAVCIYLIGINTEERTQLMSLARRFHKQGVIRI